LVSGIVQWLIIFTELSVGGFVFIALASMGNSVYNRCGIVTMVSMLTGIAALGITSIFTFVDTTQNEYFTTVKYSGYVRFCVSPDAMRLFVCSEHENLTQ
jgi:hypothetical protein